MDDSSQAQEGGSLSFGQDVAARKAMNNPWGITSPAPSNGVASDEQVGVGLNDRNGSDVSSDQYDEQHGMGPSRTNTLHSVGQGDTVEKIAKDIYGDQWRSGMALLIRDNNLQLNQYGSPIIRLGQTLNAWDTSVYSEAGLRQLSNFSNAVEANNSNGLAYKAQQEAQAIANDAANERHREENRYAALTQSNRSSTASVSGQPQMMEQATYDAMGNVTGTEMVQVDHRPAMGYGDQMRNVGRFVKDLGLSAVKGIDNLIPETAAFGYRMTGYAAAGVVAQFNTNVSDRMFAQYEKVTRRLFDYDNGVQEFGGITAQLASPTIFKGMSAAGTRLYELEQNVKQTVNYDYRHWFSGTQTLQADTTFYAYKNSNYLVSDYQPMQLWLTPELMTSVQAVQKLALPYAKGYDTLLTVTLPEGAKIMNPRPVWSLFGRLGGGVETRVYSPVTNDMYKISPAPTNVPK
ncbi:MAG: hypothetical protein NVSMB6_31900 [Burkholderiaceae bacterium]